jgi:hypothetical protein
MIINNALMAFSIGSLPELPALLVGGPTPPAAAGAVFVLDRRESIKALVTLAATTTWISSSAPASALEGTAAAAVVTDKVAFDVRISRQDGTFYMRDNLPDTPENAVFQGRIVVGLFGKAAT